MDKFPLTSVGISTLQEVLYSLSDAELRTEADLLAVDPLAYIAAHFEVQVHQIELLRSIQEDFMQMLGWNIAAALLGRRPITVSCRQDIERKTTYGKPCILYNCTVSSHVADNMITATGGIDIIYTGEPLTKH